MDALVSALSDRVSAPDSSVRAAVESVLYGREQQRLADLKLRRGIFKLADLGVSQREIAALAGISQAEVSRRLSRRALTTAKRSPREVILERQAGMIDSERMVQELSRMAVTHRNPRKSAAYDGAAVATGTAKELAAAFQDGLISEQEYEKVRQAIASRRIRAR